MKIETIPIANIKRAKYNPRKVLKPSDPEYKRLKKSLDRFGTVVPLVWNKTSGNLVSGHQRLTIIEESNPKTVDVVVVKLDDKQEKSLNLALNRHASDWDLPKLADVLQQLDGPNMEASMFGEADLSKMLAWQPSDKEFQLFADPLKGKAAKPIKKLTIETAAVSDLKPHPRNYLKHPPDQLKHLIASIEQHGYYRNILISKDNTILAGHGIWEALKQMGVLTAPVIRLDVGPNDPKALKVLAGDNQTRNLAEVDDRALSVLLKEIKDVDLEGLIGTGFDELMLANLIYITRHKDEIEDFNAAAEYIGMPEYDPKQDPLRVTVCFDNEQDRTAFMEKVGITIINQKFKNAWTVWFPERPRENLIGKRFSQTQAS